MFEQAFRNIDDVLRKESGCTTELDYIEQTSWLLFLKYLDGFEQDRSDEAELKGKSYPYILDKAYRWESWAAPKTKNGLLDHNKAQTGYDLRDFFVTKLFAYLQGFRQRASGPNTIEYKIGEIFAEIKNATPHTTAHHGAATIPSANILISGIALNNTPRGAFPCASRNVRRWRASFAFTRDALFTSMGMTCPRSSITKSTSC